MTPRISARALAPMLPAPSGRGPAYRELADHLRLLVLDGRVPLGVALPGERELAAALGLSRTTVTGAYRLLREGGCLTGRQGARSTTALPGRSGTSTPGPEAPDGVLDLAYAALPAAPQAVHAAYAAALQDLPAHLPSHGYSPAGVGVLREAVAETYTARGLPTTAEQILVTSGAQHALHLVLRLVTAAGDRVVVDHPSYPHALDAVREARCRPVPVALGSTGWDVAGYRAALRQTAPTMAYVIPDFHNPTGRCMTGQERAAIVRAARESRTTLVVDETLVDLHLDGPPPPPAAVHHPDVISIGSTSKSYWAGLRIGWVRATPGTVARLAAARPSVDMGSPIVEQLATAALLRDPDVLPARREQLRVQRTALVALLGEHLPGWRFEVPPGGLSLWAELPEPVSSALAALAPRHGLRLAAGPRFGVDGTFERFLRLPFTLPVADLERTVSGLARADAALGSASLDPVGSTTSAQLA
ncbi:PLP-dependent aminotransferase family protein [Kocuria oceani]|uniref:PLP-dependent aminotransferase family protein n=1 Tax=Kocuria oceani TaxID=988827 RepID=A0ABV9TIQ5_9MICC|nr:PLP-dependent aminotransferase family protein [Kocuria oceani]